MKFTDKGMRAPLVWSIEDIAAYLNISKSSVRGLVNDPGFPVHITPGCRNRRWFADEVLAFLRANRAEASVATKAVSNPRLTHINPINVTVRGARR